MSRWNLASVIRVVLGLLLVTVVVVAPVRVVVLGSVVLTCVLSRLLSSSGRVTM